MERIELHSIDIHLAHTRYKESAVEKRLLLSIQQQDILEPLKIVHENHHDQYILIDGFKRYRCAVKLHIKTVPVECIGTDIVIGIMTFLRRDAAKKLCTLEQAALIEELHSQHNMSIYDIATCLERSPSWVSMRLGLLDELSPLIREKIMTGAFPARAYMYDIKGFTRVNKTSSQQLDACVEALSGKHISTRALSLLIPAYFRGGEKIQRLITEGDIHKVLDMIKRTEAQIPFTQKGSDFVDLFKMIARDIKRILTIAESVNKCSDVELLNSINVWCSELLSMLPSFQKILKDVYEKSANADYCSNTLQSGAEQKSNCQTAGH
jgi:ParB/RepB/Spo0J family partition protein